MSENVKEELQKLNNRLDRCKYRLDAAAKRDDQSIVKQFKVEIETINKKIAKMKGRQQHTVGNQGSEVLRMPFKTRIDQSRTSRHGQI